MSTYFVDRGAREEMRYKMSTAMRRGRMRNGMGGTPGAQFKSDEETKEAYCEGYKHGYEDAMKEVGEGSGELRTSEFKYGM